MKILFIGGTGNISSECVKPALSKGHELFLLNRGNRELNIEDNVQSIKCDINDKEAMAKVLEENSFDVVVNWIVFNPAEIQRDIEYFSGKIKQYIFISTASAYHKPQHSVYITEDTPLYNPGETGDVTLFSPGRVIFLADYAIQFATRFARADGPGRWFLRDFFEEFLFVARPGVARGGDSMRPGLVRLFWNATERGGEENFRFPIFDFRLRRQEEEEEEEEEE